MADQNFKKEKRFLFVTLISFSVSYMIEVARNTVLFIALDEHNGHFDAVNLIFCNSNFAMSINNICTWAVTELIPYVIIFSLNFGNFSQIDRQDEYMEEQF